MADPTRQAHFDVFLSHNSKDKPAVIALAKQLQANGINVWLDAWELRPGQPWQEALEAIIETCGSAAILVGADGLGPWEDMEMRACLAQFVRRKLPVIPVLLPDCPQQPHVPLFMQGLTWVDCRGGRDEDSFDRLRWGITGVKPPISQPQDGKVDKPDVLELLRKLRELMLTDHSLHSLQTISYELEAILLSLSGSPNYAEARLLKQQIDTKIKNTERKEINCAPEKNFFGWNRETSLYIATISIFLFSLLMTILNPRVATQRPTIQEPEMVSLRGGEFWMGSDKQTDPLAFGDEMPRHKVTVKPFSIGQYEVTVGEYAAFVKATHRPSQGCWVYSASDWNKEATKSWNDPGFPQDEKNPVVCVSHADAQAYAHWLQAKTGKPYRLPTEAEWEYAARAWTDTPWFWPEGESAINAYAWYAGNAGGSTHPVGEKKPNAFGLYDTAGNAWEWVEDGWHVVYDGAQSDGRAWVDGNGADRVLRGGSWRNLGRFLRSAIRRRFEPDYGDYDIGFRLALGQPSP